MSSLMLEELSVGYDRPLLTIDSAAIGAGERVALTGDNGSGKSTLVKTLVGLLPPLAGRCITGARHGLGYLPQQGSEDRQFPLSVYEWVVSGATRHRGPFGAFRRPDHDRATAMLNRLGLFDRASVPLHELSGGQWQRTRLARLLIQGADCLMLDEPFNNIDELSQALILNELRVVARGGCSVLCVLHDMDLARGPFETHWHLCDGRLREADLHDIKCPSNLHGTGI